MRRKELLIGGLADHVPDSRFNRRDLEYGTRHELEHADSKKIAREIAKDHLLEDPDYYRKLKKMMKNPGIPKSVKEHYKYFHGAEPGDIDVKKLWVPGELVLMGKAIEVQYVITNKDSSKEKGILYVHDHKKGVKVYRRAKSNERPNLSYERFPANLMVLGRFPGLIYERDGKQVRVKLAKAKLCVTPDKKRLAVVGARGVEFLIKGGKLNVTDWIYN